MVSHGDEDVVVIVERREKLISGRKSSSMD
jgi:hypothetical protein